MSEGSEEPQKRSLRTTDPVTMRALAHPLRVEILSLLDSEGEFTASQVAERLGQTVANASFHLRTLEKHGYVERGEQRGREKPWRAAHHSRNLMPDPNDPASIRQSSSVASIYVQREAARLLNTFERMSVEDVDPKWVGGTTVSNSEFWATAEEMEDLVSRLIHLLEPFEGRKRDPAKRPEGSRRGFFFAAVNPDPDSKPWDPEAAAEHPDETA